MAERDKLQEAIKRLQQVQAATKRAAKEIAEERERERREAAA